MSLTDFAYLPRARCCGIPLRVGLALACLVAAASGAGAFTEEARFFLPSAETPGTRLVCTQIPADAWDRVPEAAFHLPRTHLDGSRIVLFSLDPAVPPVNLTEGFAAAADPEIAFDGSRMYFSAKREPGDPWGIWVHDFATRTTEAIVTLEGNAWEPTLPGLLNMLNDPNYDPLIFISDVHGGLNEADDAPATSLYAVPLPGEVNPFTVNEGDDGVRRISFGLNSAFGLSMLHDGRILFTSWERANGRHAPFGLLPLMTLNIDGTDLMPFVGNHDLPRMKSMARETDDWQLVFIQSDGSTPCGGGELARLSLRRPLYSTETLAADRRGYYHSPRPVAGGGLLVSYLDTRRGTYDLHFFDLAKKRLGAPVLASDDWHELDVQVVASRSKPRGRSTFVDESIDRGTIYLMDAQLSTLPEIAGLPRGVIREIRVIEGLPRQDGNVADRLLPTETGGSPGATYAGATGFGRRRIVGYAPVEKDGSFHVLVPPDTPIQFQILDEHKRALATLNSWIWSRPREHRGCIGCHEDRELTPPNLTQAATIKPAADLRLPPERRRSVEFVRDVQPVLQQNCTDSNCHAGSAASLRLTARPADGGNTLAGIFGEPYAALLAGGHVVPGAAKDSPLIQQLHTKPPHAALDKLDLQILTEWIDLGAGFTQQASPPKLVQEGAGR